MNEAASNLATAAAIEQKQEAVHQVLSSNLVVTSVTHEHISVTELFNQVFFDPYNVLILFFLILLGIAMKKGQKFPDWAILFIQPVAGIILSLTLRGTLGNTNPAVCVMAGASDGILAFFAHALLKQALESPAGPALMKIPFFTILVALIDENLLKPAIERKDDKGQDLNTMEKQILKGTGDGTDNKKSDE